MGNTIELAESYGVGPFTEALDAHTEEVLTTGGDLSTISPALLTSKLVTPAIRQVTEQAQRNNRPNRSNQNRSNQSWPNQNRSNQNWPNQNRSNQQNNNPTRGQVNPRLPNCYHHFGLLGYATPCN